MSRGNFAFSENFLSVFQTASRPLLRALFVTAGARGGGRLGAFERNDGMKRCGFSAKMLRVLSYKPLKNIENPNNNQIISRKGLKFD